MGLAAVVHRSRTFHHRSAALLPALCRCGEDFRGTDLSRGCELCDTERLKIVGHAGPDEVVAPAVETDDAAVDTPNIS